MRLDHLLSMENVKHGSGAADASKFENRQKPKKDGESALKQSMIACCSILSDRKENSIEPHR